MSEKEKQIVEKLKEVLPNMSDFDKGYLLGKAETMADAADNKPKNDEQVLRKENNERVTDIRQ